MAKDSGRIIEFVRPSESAEARTEPPKLDREGHQGIRGSPPTASSSRPRSSRGRSSGPSGGIRPWLGPRSRPANRGSTTEPSTWRGHPERRGPLPGAAPRRRVGVPAQQARARHPHLFRGGRGRGPRRAGGPARRAHRIPGGQPDLDRPVRRRPRLPGPLSHRVRAVRGHGGHRRSRGPPGIGG